MNPSEIVYIKNNNLLHDAQQIIETAQQFAYRAVNVALVQRNWLLGKRIADPNIFQTVSGKSENKIFHTACGKSLSANLDALRLNSLVEILDSVTPKSFSLLTGSHYRMLLQEKDPDARNWYHPKKNCVRKSKHRKGCFTFSNRRKEKHCE